MESVMLNSAVNLPTVFITIGLLLGLVFLTDMTGERTDIPRVTLRLVISHIALVMVVLGLKCTIQRVMAVQALR